MSLRLKDSIHTLFAMFTDCVVAKLECEVLLTINDLSHMTK